MTKYIWGAEIGVDNENDLYEILYMRLFNRCTFHIEYNTDTIYHHRFPRKNVYDGYPTHSDVTKCFVFPYKHD